MRARKPRLIDACMDESVKKNMSERYKHGFDKHDDIPEMQLHTALLQMLNRGKRLALPPETVGQDVEEIIMKCWDRDPTRRPNFPALLHFFSTKAID